MSRDQSMRIAVAFARETARSPTARLCGACVDVIHVTGAGITVLAGSHPGPICVSSSGVAGLETLQFDTGVGPCRDAYHSGQSVHVPRLDADAARRWPPFVDLAHVSGIRAVSAYPLINEDTRVGVMTLYRADEGELTDAQHDDSVAVARVLADTLVSLQAADPTTTELDESFAYRAEIHQASGMAAVQLGITPNEGLMHIRAHGLDHGMTVLEVATEIVARRLRLQNNPPDRQR